MGNHVWGSCKENRVTPSDAITTLKGVEDRCEKRIKYLERQKSEFYHLARDHVKVGQKQQALGCLMRHKRADAAVTKLMSQSDLVYKIRLDIEQMIMTTETITGIQTSSQVMTGLKANLDPQKLDDLLADMHDHVKLSNDVLGMMAQGSDEMDQLEDQQYDQEALEKELNDIIRGLDETPRKRMQTTTTETEDEEILRQSMQMGVDRRTSRSVPAKASVQI